MNHKDNLNFIFQLNNKSRSGNVFLLFILSGILFVGIAFYFVAVNLTIPLIINIIVAIAYFIVFSKIKPCFLEFLITENSLQVNYYAVWSTVRTYQSIEIPLHQVVDFQMITKMGGMKKELILSVDSKYGIADYPPISISLLTRNQIAQLIHVLQQIKNNNS